MNIGSNAGHTLKGKGSGAIGFLNESVCTRQINNYFVKGLIKNNIRPLDCTIEYSNKYLDEAVRKANSMKLDFAISHHLNHSDNAEAHGVEVWIYDLNNKKTYDMAYNICNELSKLGLRNRGVKVSKDFYWLKYTCAKALIIEYCFCSNIKDTNIYNPQKFAEASINGILKSL